MTKQEYEYATKETEKYRKLVCEHCHHHELEMIGKPIKSDIDGQQAFQQKYKCLHCGAIGVVAQIWVKERGEDDKE